MYIFSRALLIASLLGFVLSIVLHPIHDSPRKSIHHKDFPSITNIDPPAAGSCLANGLLCVKDSGCCSKNCSGRVCKPKLEGRLGLKKKQAPYKIRPKATKQEKSAGVRTAQMEQWVTKQKPLGKDGLQSHQPKEDV
ncbi:uncharacterized protein LY89DRAFT_740273 [Mollisia scopiformis]|uniref:WAP domain-containing protein n=1 Tax=Mollisia scopiformis TaxID=149040 RepID=A0A132BDR9_MOLSC|nr:uncharacterized protein LY89DRAFT_740273 [Mollisia scopiformis]KUJ10565.1 hypothetical protein LY89DRAFT_740273 [Mollisia scopiformis]